MGDYIHNVKQYFSLETKEVIHVIITALVAGFVLGFNNWGGDKVNVSAGLEYTLSATIFIFLGLLLHVCAQKLMGIKLGYVSEYSMWKFGLLIGVFITFLTNGLIPVFFTGTLNSKIVERLRVGKFPPRFKHWEYGLLSFTGPLANLLLVLGVQGLFLSSGGFLVNLFIESNLWLIFYSMIPIPLFHGVRVIEEGRTAYDIKGGTIGFNLFLASRPLYMFFLTLTLAYLLLIKLGGIFSFWLAVLIALVMTLVYYFNVENQ